MGLGYFLNDDFDIVDERAASGVPTAFSARRGSGAAVRARVHRGPARRRDLVGLEAEYRFTLDRRSLSNTALDFALRPGGVAVYLNANEAF